MSIAQGEPESLGGPFRAYPINGMMSVSSSSDIDKVCGPVLDQFVDQFLASIQTY